MAETKASQDNIQKIIDLEEEAERERSLADRAAETIGDFVGTVAFVAVELGFVAAWIALNAAGGWFDPYPFPLLSGLVAFQGVIFTAFILIRQNRMSLRADRRNHLDLQINLLAEQEATKILQMLERMSRKFGIEDEVSDPDAEALASDTSIDGIAHELRETMEEDEEGKHGAKGGEMHTPEGRES